MCVYELSEFLLDQVDQIDQIAFAHSLSPSACLLSGSPSKKEESVVSQRALGNHVFDVAMHMQYVRVVVAGYIANQFRHQS